MYMNVLGLTKGAHHTYALGVDGAEEYQQWNNRVHHGCEIQEGQASADAWAQILQASDTTTE